MRYLKFLSLSAGLAAWISSTPLQVSADSPTSTPTKPWKEAYDLILTNLHLSSETELNQVAVERLITKFPNRILWETNATTASNPASRQPEPSASSKSFQTQYAYLRALRFDPSLPSSLHAEWKSLSASNQLRGVVLDLRFAGGASYEAAAHAARLFIPGSTPLLSVAGKDIPPSPSPIPTEFPQGPIAILINHKTQEAAEALALLLKQERSAVIIGSKSAGTAGLYQTYTLSNGDRLKLLTGEIKTALGVHPVGTPILPDLAVSLPEADESRFMSDPYASPVSTKTGLSNAPKQPAKPAPKLNEATLVRRQKEENQNLQDDPSDPSRTAAIERPKPPELRDPVLARGLDLVEGIVITADSRLKQD